MRERPTLSVVAPVYREEETIDEFLRRLRLAIDALELPSSWELILVDDGSPDKSLEHLREAAAADSRVRVVHLSRNFGHQVAITCGLDHAAGDAVVIMDSDLQDPPEVIARMVEEWRAGADVVYGVRNSRDGESTLKVLSARAFYRLLSHLSETPLPVDAGDFRLLDRSVVLALQAMREENRYLRGMVSWLGFRQVPISYARARRHAGTTNYNFRKMLRLAVDGVTGFSERPLRLAFQFGVMVTLASMAYVCWILVARLVHPAGQSAGYASLMCVVLFIGGIQLICVGLLGEYIGRIYREIKRRPLYVVKEAINLVNWEKSNSSETDELQ
ncbi:MAG: glycosyltransferase family 2 protein [Acidimicrobiales bacterium]|jgi:dolichol-phosphate mannosyltransferase